MTFENRHLFNSSINNQHLKDFFRLDYTTKNYEDRVKNVEEMLQKVRDTYERNYFEVFFDEHYKVNVSSTDSLSERINVCKTIESLTNYLLGSTEVREERKKNEIKYRFYVNAEEFKLRCKKEMLYQDVVKGDSCIDIECEDNVLHFLNSKSNDNFKKQKKQKLFPSDFIGEDDLARILNEYQSLLDKTTYLLKHPDESPVKRKKLTTMKKSIVDDMLDTKNCLKGTFGTNLKNPLQESTKPCWDYFDYTNPTHIKYALRLKASNDLKPAEDLSHIVLDMCIVLKKLCEDKVITKQQHRVISLIQQGYTNKDIEDELGIHNSRVVHIITAVSKKIAKHYQMLESGRVKHG